MCINRRIGFIGAGKVGSALGLYFKQNGLSVSGFHSRTEASAGSVCEFTGTQYYPDAASLSEASDIVFITTGDASIAAVWDSLTASGADLSQKIICHCSGSLGSDIFSDASVYGAYRCSLHPLLAFPKRLDIPEALPRALFTAEGDSEAVPAISAIVSRCGNTLQWIKSSDKIRYHAAAVFASNLGVALYDMAFSMLQSAGFSPENARQAFSPLIRGNVDSVLSVGPEASLTGPIERNDISTVQSHLNSLSNGETNVYKALSLQALSIAAKKHPDTDFSAISDLLSKE